MNRQIKFRAFTKLGMIEDVIYYRQADNDETNPTFMIHIEAFEEQVRKPELEDHWDSCELEKYDLYLGDEVVMGQVPIMQFTGLKDKNGKEIYESDFFKVANNNTYIIKWCDGGESNNEWYGGCFVLWLNEETFFPIDEWAIKNGKVIGNIHQNPELL